MAQIVHILGEVFHVPSIARTRLYATSYLGSPRILIINHNGIDTTLRYSLKQWEMAKYDYKKLEASRSACYEALKQVPLLEISEVNPLVESEMQLK